jgi:putative ABC transport system permease protein
MQNFLEAAKIAAGSIWANKLRSFLTLLGVIIGVSVVIAVATVIEGANVYVDEKLADLGSGNFVVQKASITGFGNFEKFLEAMRKNPDIEMDDVEALRRDATLAAYVGAQDGTAADAKHENQAVERIGLQGVTPDIIYMSQIDVASGRYFSEFDEESRRPVAFVGSEIATALYPGQDPVGKEIRIDGRPFTVIGVAASMGSVLGQSQDNFINIPLSTFLKVYGGRRSLTLTIKARDGVPIERVQDQVRTILRARHQLTFDKADDFAIVNDEAIQNLFGQIIGIISAVTIPITLISLVVGGIVIMNIMLVVVTERTREIGIRKSLGARRKDILLQFLVESTILSGIGGAIGIVIGYIISKGLSYFLPIPVALPVMWSIIAVTLSAAVGLFFGIYPANRAAKLDPITALRAD